MVCRKSIELPIEALPALKGLCGQKVRDTQEVTQTKIHFKRKSSTVLAHIIGSCWKNVSRAEKILKLCVKHLNASLCPLKSMEVETMDEEDVERDLRTFYFETFCGPM